MHSATKKPESNTENHTIYGKVGQNSVPKRVKALC